MTSTPHVTLPLLHDKRVLITGGGGGLGAALAHGVVRAGARVIVADVDGIKARAVATAIARDGGSAWAEVVDVTDQAAVTHWAHAVQARIGPIDVLINNAGVAGRACIDDAHAPQVWERILAVNLQGVFNVTHAFVPQLKQTRGCIVNLSSITAFVSGVSSAGYVATKGAVRSLTQALARDLAPHGVRVNAVAPGLMLTDMVAPQLHTPGGVDWYMQRVPMQRCGQPEEIVGPVVFLASAMASYVNGVVLPVDGGFLSV